MSEYQQILAPTISVGATPAMYAGCGIAAISNTTIGLIGLLIAAAGFLVNLHYKRLENARQRIEHSARMEQHE